MAQWWCLPNTIREIIRMFPETAFLHDPAMLWQFVAASCLQVVVIASLYLTVARIPARWVPWLRIATLAAFAAICIGSNALVIATASALRDSCILWDWPRRPVSSRPLR